MSRPTPLAKRMKAKNQILMCGYSTQGNLRFWLEPSQKPVGDRSAQRTIASGWLEPLDFGLFGNAPQSYRVRDEV